MTSSCLPSRFDYDDENFHEIMSGINTAFRGNPLYTVANTIDGAFKIALLLSTVTVSLFKLHKPKTWVIQLSDRSEIWLAARYCYNSDTTNTKSRCFGTIRVGSHHLVNKCHRNTDLYTQGHIQVAVPRNRHQNLFDIPPYIVQLQ